MLEHFAVNILDDLASRRHSLYWQQNSVRQLLLVILFESLNIDCDYFAQITES